MKLIEKLKKKKSNETPANIVCGHLTANNGIQIGEYSFGVCELTYLDANGKPRKAMFWVAQR